MNNQPELNRIFVKPTDAHRITINPETNRRIPAEGELVLNNKYFRRRIADGDLVETTLSEAVTKAKGSKTTQKED